MTTATDYNVRDLNKLPAPIQFKVWIYARRLDYNLADSDDLQIIVLSIMVDRLCDGDDSCISNNQDQQLKDVFPLIWDKVVEDAVCRLMDV